MEGREVCKADGEVAITGVHGSEDEAVSRAVHRLQAHAISILDLLLIVTPCKRDLRSESFLSALALARSGLTREEERNEWSDHEQGDGNHEGECVLLLGH